MELEVLDGALWVIDLHSHILPGIDDGAPDLATALAMARAMVADGVTCVACTPHILPGLYQNTGADIRARVDALRLALADAGIPLEIVTGSDNHVVPSFVRDIERGHLLTLADTRYVLVEPPHHIMPPQLEFLFSNLLGAGYVPVLTHPERLTWINQQYDVVQRLAGNGVWMQITAGSLLGAFGRSAQRWSERMLDEGIVHILASDAHDLERRPPVLGRARAAAAKRVGAIEASHLVETRPRGILLNEHPSNLPVPTGANAGAMTGDDYDNAMAVGAMRGGGIAGRLRRLFA